MFPAITVITAKIMVIVDALLENFVTLSMVDTGAANCVLAYSINGQISGCGYNLVALLDQLILGAIGLGAGILPALGVNVAV